MHVIALTVKRLFFEEKATKTFLLQHQQYTSRNDFLVNFARLSALFSFPVVLKSTGSVSFLKSIAA